MLKVLLPYADHQTQKTLAVYIKFLELNYTLDFYRKHPFPLCGCVQQEEKPDIGCLCEELLPFCTEAEKQKLLQIKIFSKHGNVPRNVKDNGSDEGLYAAARR